MWLYRYSYRFNTFFHIYYIFTLVIVKAKVYFVFTTSALSHGSWCCWFCGVRSFLAAVLWFTAVICWGLFLHLSFSMRIPPSLNNSNHIPSHSAPISSPCPRWVPALGALQPAFSGVCMPLCSAWCSLSSRVAVQVVVLRCNRSPLVFFVY